MKNREFALRLKNTRTALDLTQKEMADALGIPHEGNVSRWENGKHMPLGIFLDKIDTLAEKAKCVMANQKKYNLPYHTVRCGLCLRYVKTKAGQHDAKRHRILCKPCHNALNFK